MSFILNIGLNGVHVPDDVALLYPVAQSFVATRAARALNFKFVRSQLIKSDTEWTLVVEAQHTGDAAACANWLAEALNQDCIAVYFPDTKLGQLIGPRAAAWGDFNPEFFFNLDGSRLSADSMKVAA
jgi:hypothetical protein